MITYSFKPTQYIVWTFTKHNFVEVNLTGAE